MLTLIFSLLLTNQVTITGNNLPIKITKILLKFSVECYSSVKTKKTS